MQVVSGRERLDCAIASQYVTASTVFPMANTISPKQRVTLTLANHDSRRSLCGGIRGEIWVSLFAGIDGSEAGCWDPWHRLWSRRYSLSQRSWPPSDLSYPLPGRGKERGLPSIMVKANPHGWLLHGLLPYGEASCITSKSLKHHACKSFVESIPQARVEKLDAR